MIAENIPQKIAVSIIMTTRNRATHLRHTLDAIARLFIPVGLSVELVVVDNGSNDQTSGVVSSTTFSNLKLVYLYEATPGKTSACNAGMSVAQGDIFLWTDDDVHPPQNWISEMCLPILRGEAMGVSGKIRTAPNLERKWMSRTHYDRLSDTRFMPEDFGSMIGANMAFHRNVLQKVPEFDPELGPGKLGFMDDTLFSYRMREAGYKIVSLPQVSVEHHFDASRLQRQAWLRQAEFSGKSIAYVYHHWDHKVVGLPMLQLLVWNCALVLFRLLCPPCNLTSEGCHRYEMRALQNISFIRQYLAERKHPRRYPRNIRQ